MDNPDNKDNFYSSLKLAKYGLGVRATSFCLLPRLDRSDHLPPRPSLLCSDRILGLYRTRQDRLQHWRSSGSPHLFHVAGPSPGAEEEKCPEESPLHQENSQGQVLHLWRN